jgi:hypothetical protein
MTGNGRRGETREIPERNGNDGLNLISQCSQPRTENDRQVESLASGHPADNISGFCDILFNHILKESALQQGGDPLLQLLRFE